MLTMVLYICMVGTAFFLECIIITHVWLQHARSDGCCEKDAIDFNPLSQMESSTLFCTIYLRVLSADDLRKQFGPRSGPTKNVGPDLDPNYLPLWWYSWKNFKKKNQLMTKSGKNYPVALHYSLTLFMNQWNWSSSLINPGRPVRT